MYPSTTSPHGVCRLSEHLNSHRDKVPRLCRRDLESIFNEAICIGVRPRPVDLYDKFSDAAVIFSIIRFKGHGCEMSRKHLRRRTRSVSRWLWLSDRRTRRTSDSLRVSLLCRAQRTILGHKDGAETLDDGVSESPFEM